MPIKAKKSFGQHFLKNEAIAQRIASSLLQAETVKKALEVGPGTGRLTRFLLEKNIDLRCVEADRDMVEHLEAHFPELKGRVIFEDFLRFDPRSAFGAEPFCLVGNFPYNISSQILFWALDHRAQVPEMVGMFQKEVAERVVAPPGSKIYGITSALMQAFFKCEMLFSVSRGNFDPPPNVESAVIRLERKEGFELGCDEKLFRQVVKMAFNQRRKMLRGTLKPLFPDQDLLADPFFERRPEQLGWADFVGLAQRIEAFRSAPRGAERPNFA